MIVLDGLLVCARDEEWRRTQSQNERDYPFLPLRVVQGVFSTLHQLYDLLEQIVKEVKPLGSGDGVGINTISPSSTSFTVPVGLLPFP